jgi:hypothetical protein
MKSQKKNEMKLQRLFFIPGSIQGWIQDFKLGGVV